jgi:hypothetical protein
MIERMNASTLAAAAGVSAGRSAAVTSGDIEAFGQRLTQLDCDVDDAGLIAQLAALEGLKAAAAAAQARVTVAFAASQRAALLAAGARPERVAGGVNAQVALARRESPHRGDRLVGLAQALHQELPHTLAAMTAGQLSEWRATIVARATAVLSAAQRREADARLAGRIAGLSDRQLDAAARAVAYELDPAAFVARASRAHEQRHVTIRPAPDTMAYLTALLPVHEAVAVYAALTRTADTARAGGDPRGRGQLMADTLVQRVTGQAGAAAVPIEVQLVMTDRAFFGPTDEDIAEDIAEATTEDTSDGATGTAPALGGDAGLPSGRPPGVDDVAFQRFWRRDPETGQYRRRPWQPPPRHTDPTGARILDLGRALMRRHLLERDTRRQVHTPALIPGVGPIPAALARRLLSDSATGAGQVWVRRLYADPDTGALVAIDPRRRTLPPALRTLLIARDQWCRTPWCGAPIRHVDHVTDHAAGGPTSLANSQGLCERCNHIKQTPGWTARSGPTQVTTTTPTGHRYQSPTPPPLPTWPQPRGA